MCLSYEELVKTVDSALVEFPLVASLCTQLLTVTCRMNTSLLMNALLILTPLLGLWDFEQEEARRRWLALPSRL